MDWHQALGFTDRLRAIQSLTTAYQQTSSSAAFAEAQAQARQCENDAYDRATSKEDYDRICQEAIDAAEPGTVGDSGSSSNINEVSPEPEDLQGSAIGEKFGHYQSCFHHFDGLHSTIYRSKAEDGSVRAIKITIPHMMTAPHDAHREIRLLREAASPHAIPLIETFKLDEGRLVLVFPFLRFDFEHLLRRDMVTAKQTRSILKDMFQALAHIHELGIIHRDIKPSNILMDSPEGPAYLADFGISWKEGDPGCEPLNNKITDVGTTCYRPPEVLFGYREYDTTLDLWAAGCVVAEATAVGHRSLFDSGPVGSDLSLIHSIFQRLGTPDENNWPGVHVLPDWGKVEFHPFKAQSWDDILPGATSKGRDLVRRMVCYESSERLSAEEVIYYETRETRLPTVANLRRPSAIRISPHFNLDVPRTPQECSTSSATSISHVSLGCIIAPPLEKHTNNRLWQVCSDEISDLRWIPTYVCGDPDWMQVRDRSITSALYRGHCMAPSRNHSPNTPPHHNVNKYLGLFSADLGPREGFLVKI